MGKKEKRDKNKGLLFDIRERTVLLTMSGSRAYGMQRPDSDIDIKGCAVPTKPYIYSMLGFDEVDWQPHIESAYKDLFTGESLKIIEATKLEGSVYDGSKFIEMATSCNPNILDVLYCRDEDVLLLTPIGRMLREQRDIFLSVKAKYRFSGYAIGQLRRINTHRKWLMDPPKAPPERSDFGLGAEPDLDRDQMNTAFAAIQKRLDSWEIDYGELDDAEIVYIQAQVKEYLAEIMGTTDLGEQGDKKWLSAGRVLGFGDNFLELLDKERHFVNAKQNWKSFLKWKDERNAERAELEAKFGYDTKHAAHLYRLMTMCREIITEGVVRVYRGDYDRDEIMAVRNGEKSYDWIVDFAAKEDAALEQLVLDKKFNVPRKPNMKKINELHMTILDMALKDPSAFKVL